MHIVTDIPFTLDDDDLMRRSRVEPGTDDAKAFAELIDRAREVGRPKALYTEAFIEAPRGDDTVTIDGITFTSRTLRRNLDGIGRVFPFVATCGHEMDEVELPADDFLAPFWWDTIKAALLQAAGTHLNEHLARRFRLQKTSTMSPGSGDATVWPIEQQRPLFDLLDGVTGHIGVTLTDSFLMIPNKTVSGIRFPTEVDFRACQLCRRENCPSRSVPIDPELWAEVENG